jgi:phosphoglucosamine mutase
MTRTYFGTDGIRGTVGQPPITPDFVLRLAHAVGRVLKREEQRPTVLIGKDTRISGYMLESALESGFNSAGVDVVLLGPLPTPGVAYLTRAQRASLGVVISASRVPRQRHQVLQPAGHQAARRVGAGRRGGAAGAAGVGRLGDAGQGPPAR